MVGLYSSVLVLCGAIVVACCWGIHTLAYKTGFAHGRTYERQLMERYEAGKRCAGLPSQIPMSEKFASREKEEWEEKNDAC